MNEQNISAKLRPPEPTPEDELCHCSTRPPIKLMSTLTYNPIHCMNCNLEVPSETLPLSDELINRIAHWNILYHALDVLWLDSGAYEAWAREQLADITSSVNILGRDVQREIDAIRRCYYWYFQDQSVDAFQPQYCPVCENVLQSYTSGIFLQNVCEQDSIVVVGEGV